MTFAFIDAERANFPISWMCRVLCVIQSGFFAWQWRPAGRLQQQDLIYPALFRTAFALSNGTYGGQRMHRDLAVEAQSRALKAPNPVLEMVHHSGRGSH